ncbi:MAG: rhomboid family intramembrane serine protease [Spirochaetales bacterium]|nr:rhomboid family intramembrane serine protease [Spirochaetales bacterium]
MRKPLFFQRPFNYSFYNATIILIIINVAVFALRLLAPNLGGLINDALTLIPRQIEARQNYWSVLTYLFVHSPETYTHILFNMFALFMFGTHIERKLGSTEFLLYYLITGLLTGITLFLLDPLMPGREMGIPIYYMGASASIYAILLAFGTFFPNVTLRIWFVLPVKAYILVIGLTAFSIFAQLTGLFGETSHIGHLAGLFFGVLYFVVRFRINPIKEFINARRYS